MALKLWHKAEFKDFLAVRFQLREDVEAQVKPIIAAVRQHGDSALMELTLRYDGVEFGPDRIEVSSEEIDEAYAAMDEETLGALRQARDNIEAFARRSLRSSWFWPRGDGLILGEMYAPVARAGIYVPGGSAPLPSSVLMAAVPARVAGVDELIMCTPPGEAGQVNPCILVAARESGVKRVFRIGGAQAIAAMAYGTETVPRVDVIAGPGNVYVTAAKRLVYGQVGIDMLAGPSEVVVLADEEADASYVAADLLSQAEHDTMASAVLVTPSEELAQNVMREIQRQITGLSRRDIIENSLNRNGAVVLVEGISEGIELVNALAPEHLELHIRDPWAVLGKIRCAGAVFLGKYTPEAIGDYLAGPSHVLPTAGTARYASPLSVDTYLKKINLICCSEEALKRLGGAAAKLAEVEGLDAHAASVRIRGDRK